MKEKDKKKEPKKKNWQPVGDKLKGAKIAKTFRIDADVFLWGVSESTLRRWEKYRQEILSLESA